MHDALTALNRRYRNSLPEKRALIAAAFLTWRIDVSRLDALRELARLLHKLAGSAGGYGYARLGESARAADGLMHEWLSDAPDDLAARQQFAGVLAPLMRAVDDLFEAAINEGVTASTAASMNANEPIRVVLVDDDVELSLLLTEQLRNEGIDVVCADSGDGMLRLLEQSLPDVLVLDFWLRGETGEDLARSVRRNAAFASLPAVCLTSDRSAEIRQRAIAAGALEVIDKGTPPRQLAGLLRMFAGRIG